MLKKIVLASNNTGKLREFKKLLSQCGYDVKAQKEYDVEDADETGLSFVENAILKARHAARITGLPALADDSGIEVDALNGAPGIYSARFSGENANDQANNAKLLHELANINDDKRTARFQCVLAFMRHAEDPIPIVVQGAWEGSILRQASGNDGFGYDPLFWVPSHQCASAELAPEEKNRISHRAIAMQKLLIELNSRYG
ncbi:MAG: XTP/dITP diphosphohydrolase [Flavobacteriales bacterium]|jgi:XTP/dITP diphosphohydrolase